MTAVRRTAKAISLTAENGIFRIEVAVNGVRGSWRVGAEDTLLSALRANGWKGVKRGCDTGECGSCTVLVDGTPELACLKLAVSAHGREITTIEGRGPPAEPHPLQEAFVEAGAVQCGFCIPGMILVSKALLDKNPEPSETQIRHALDGNLCRCTGYVKQVEAVRLAAGKIKNREVRRAGQ